MKEALHSKDKDQNPHQIVKDICGYAKGGGGGGRVESGVNKVGYDPSMQSNPKPHGRDQLPRGFKECSNTMHTHQRPPPPPNPHPLVYPCQHNELTLLIS